MPRASRPQKTMSQPVRVSESPEQGEMDAGGGAANITSVSSSLRGSVVPRRNTVSQLRRMFETEGARVVDREDGGLTAESAGKCPIPAALGRTTDCSPPTAILGRLSPMADATAAPPSEGDRSRTPLSNLSDPFVVEGMDKEEEIERGNTTLESIYGKYGAYTPPLP